MTNGAFALLGERMALKALRLWITTEELEMIKNNMRPIHPALSALEALHADDLTPKQALDALYQLKELMDTPV